MSAFVAVAGMPAFNRAIPVGNVEVSNAYEDVERGISGLVALWILNEASGTALLDAEGNVDGTYSGTIQFNAAALPAESSSGAANFAGTGSATIPHAAALALSAFSLSLWFKLALLPEDLNRFVILAKEASGNNAGDTTIVVEDDGTLTIQMNAGSGSIQLPFVQLNTDTTYHLVLRADGTGFDAYLNGRFVGSSAGHTGAWTSNTASIELAEAASLALSTPPANVIINHIALYNRRITENEVLLLSQQTGAPVAVGETVSVPESATTAINVLVNDTFVGTPTLSIIAQPSGGDSVAVDGLVIDYTAGAVAVDTARSFQYRITDANGVSNTVTVNVTVLNSAAPPATALPFDLSPLPYVESSAGTVVVSTAAELAAAINAAPPGRNILVTSGTKTGGTHTFTPNGTTANPIVVRTQGVTGSTTFDSARWTINGDGLVISRLYFTDARISLNNTDSIRIARCRFRNITGGSIGLNAATNTRVSHCDAAGYASGTGSKGFVKFNDENIGNGSLRRVLVDHCYVHDINPDVGANGQSPIGTESSSNNAGITNPQFVMDHCLYENVRLPEEGELIGAKFVGGVVQFSTFRSNLGGPAYINLPRTGKDWVLRSCWIGPGMKNPTVIVQCLGSKVIGCVLEGNKNMELHGSTSTSPSGYWTTSNYQSHHFAADQALIAGCVLGTGQIQIGGNNTPARNCRIEACIRNGAPATTSNGIVNNGISTVIQGTTAEVFDLALELEPNDIGLAAADPHDLTGPQS